MAKNRLKEFFQSADLREMDNESKYPIQLHDVLGYLNLSITGVGLAGVEYEIEAKRKLFISGKSNDSTQCTWTEYFKQIVNHYELFAFAQACALMAVRTSYGKPKRYPALRLGNFTLTVLNIGFNHVHVHLVHRFRIKWFPLLKKYDTWDLAFVRKDFDSFVESIGGL